MTLFIEGLAFPLNQKNANGWGIPASEADNAIKTLQSSVIRICPRDGPHDCDFTEDPKAEVGRIVAAWREGDVIRARGQITDSTAIQKISDGTWEKNWSTYIQASNIDSEGWATGIEARSMTLVRNPAWSQAAWEITASDNGASRFRTLSQFTLIASQKEGETITEEIEELKTQLAERDKLIEELKVSASKVPEFEKQVGELTASLEDLKGKLEEKTTLIASLEKGKARSLTLEEAQKLVASELEKYKAEVQAANERDTAFKAFASAREKLGIETKAEDFKTLTAADLNKLAEDLGGVELGASGVQYPAGNPGKSELSTIATGIYNPKSGAWE
jgi:hypothetical protein